MKYHPFFFSRKLGMMSQNLLSAAFVIGALRVKGTDIDKGGRNCKNIKCSRPSAEAFCSIDKQYVGLQRYAYLTI